MHLVLWIVFSIPTFRLIIRGVGRWRQRRAGLVTTIPSQPTSEVDSQAEKQCAYASGRATDRRHIGFILTVAIIACIFGGIWFVFSGPRALKEAQIKPSPETEGASPGRASRDAPVRPP